MPPDQNQAKNESLDALARLVAIRTAAGDRPLTQAQQRDQQEQVRRLDSAIDVLGGESRYLESLRQGMREAEDPTFYAQEAARVANFEAVARKSDAFRGSSAVRFEGPRGGTGRFDADNLFSTRALAGDVVDGSSVVAKEYSDEVWSRLYKANPLLSAGLTEFETSDYSFILPIGTASVSVSVTGQGTAITASDPGFTSQEIIPQRFGALTTVSEEFWSDITTAQKEYILNDHVRSISNEVEVEMLTGNGSPGFTGLYGTTAAGTVTGGTVTALGLSPYAQALGTAAASNITPTHWIVSPSDYGQLVRVTEGGTATNGSLRPLLTPAANAGGAVSTSLFGLPVLVTPNAAAGTALLISAPELIFVKRRDVEQLQDPYTNAHLYQRRLRTVVRSGFYALPQRFVRISALA